MPRLKGNASDTALKKIVQKINDYELSSGEIVSDLELSNELNISRTPVREAMQQLIDIGLLERTATKVVVRSITLTDIVEIFQIREAIEIMSVKIILSNGGLTEAQKLELMDIHQNLCNDISNGNFDKNFSDDTAFHEKLIEYSGNSRMEDISRRISLQSQRLRWLTLLTPSRYAGTRDEHERIIQGILNQDLDSTARAIQEHLQGSLENYTQILNNNQWMKIMSELKNMNPKRNPRKPPCRSTKVAGRQSVYHFALPAAFKNNDSVVFYSHNIITPDPHFIVPRLICQRQSEKPYQAEFIEQHP